MTEQGDFQSSAAREVRDQTGQNVKIASATLIGHMMSEDACNDVMGSSLIVPCSSVFGFE